MKDNEVEKEKTSSCGSFNIKKLLYYIIIVILIVVIIYVFWVFLPNASPPSGITGYRNPLGLP